MPGLSDADLHSYVLGLAYLLDHDQPIHAYEFDERTGSQEELMAVLTAMRAAARELTLKQVTAGAA